MTASDTLLALREVRFAWPGEEDLLRIAHFEIGRQERVFLQGPSGSGKSTLLGLISGVLAPSYGDILFGSCTLSDLSASKRDKLRADKMGVIFQLFNLLPYLNLIENVVLPCRFSKARKARACQKSGSVDNEAKRLLARLGLTDETLLHKKVGLLSVGQQQRVAAARALIGAPDLIIADEPTSALDRAARDTFLNLLLEEADQAGASLLFVSHDEALGSAFQTRISLANLNSG